MTLSLQPSAGRTETSTFPYFLQMNHSMAFSVFNTALVHVVLVGDIMNHLRSCLNVTHQLMLINITPLSASVQKLHKTAEREMTIMGDFKLYIIIHIIIIYGYLVNCGPILNATIQ